MMRHKLCFLLALALAPVSLWAKPSVPMNFSLTSTSSEKVGDQTRYHVEVKFIPLTNSDRVTLQLMLPEKYRLLEGVSYWEGQVAINETLSKQLLIEGPSETPDSIRLLAEMEMGSARSSKVLTLRLSATEDLQSSSYPILIREKGEASETRRIRRE
jgi:hypothetical protein